MFWGFEDYCWYYWDESCYGGGFAE
jgi:hypothetical protein